MAKIYVVGIGPGSYENMTQRAQEALQNCDVIVGYTVYIDLVKEHFPDKQMLTTPMRREVERCRLAFEQAQQGKTVAMICSGDAGIYGMTGVMEELRAEYPGVELENVPGISAVISGAAILGAPLMHDFAVISLSDLLTPWEVIETRLRCAAELNTLEGEFSGSEFVRSVTGVDCVSERAALLASDGGRIVCRKIAAEGMTFALAETKEEVCFG